MLAILSPILVFGLVIFVHELGHFIAAKLTGVYAPRFSIGFGPALFKRRKGETEYILAALPLGGYVRMASRHDGETAFLEGGNEEQQTKPPTDPDYDPEAMIPFGPKPVPENRWFESKPLLARLFIMTAGVVMNAVLAVVVLTVLAMSYGRLVYPLTTIGAVRSVADAPQLAQLQAGDSIVRVNGAPTSSWNEVRQRILESRETVAIATNRGEVSIPVRSDGPTPSQIADALVYKIPPVIDSVVAGDRAAQAGFQVGDSIVSVEGRPVRSWTDVVDVVSRSANKPVTFVVQRPARPETLTATPRPVEEQDPVSRELRTVGKIGAAAPDLSERGPIGFGESVSLGASATWSMAGEVVATIRNLILGRVSVKQLGGPIAITRASVSAARGGVDQLFSLIALLSINVAVLNLFPIPILDGGQIVITVLESAKGRPFSLRTREYIQRFGLLAIALLFAIVMYNDTRSGFAKLFGWMARLFS
jgi:regulator of sigma E protease